jgi:hypothetical protein
MIKAVEDPLELVTLTFEPEGFTIIWKAESEGFNMAEQLIEEILGSIPGRDFSKATETED